MKVLSLLLFLGSATVGGLVLGAVVAPSLRHSQAAAPVDSPQLPGSAGPSLVVVAPAPAAAVYKTVDWESLMPKNWDPLKKYRGMNFDALSDADPQAIEMLQRMRESWNNAPVNMAMDGQAVRIAGYLVPLDENKSGLTRFLLVPYFGACIHTPPPPSNQIIDVTPTSPSRFKVITPIWVTGKLRVERSDTVLGTTSYRMDANQVDLYMAGLDRGLNSPTANQQR
jgi:uncharacterized protein